MSSSSQPARNASRQLRRVALLHRITACVFAVTAVFYAVNSHRHAEAEFDLAMAGLQFSLAIVFFLVSVGYSRKARAAPGASTGGSGEK